MLQLEEYRKVQVHPNFDRPHMTKQDLRRSKNELNYMNSIACMFLIAVGITFVAMAYATRTYVLATIGVAWLVIYYAMVLIMSDTRNKRTGNMYLLIHKEISTDPEIGVADCLMVAYQPETDMMHKVDVPYRIYREAEIGDWFFMYVNSDNEYTIPEYPNRYWRQLRKNKEGDDEV